MDDGIERERERERIRNNNNKNAAWKSIKKERKKNREPVSNEFDNVIIAGAIVITCWVNENVEKHLKGSFRSVLFKSRRKKKKKKGEKKSGTRILWFKNIRLGCTYKNLINSLSLLYLFFLSLFLRLYDDFTLRVELAAAAKKKNV